MIVRTTLTLLLLSGPLWAQSVLIGSGSQEQIGAGAQVLLSPAGLDVQAGGTLTIAGTSATSQGQGKLTSGVTAGVAVNALTGSTIDFKFGQLENILKVVVANGAKVNRIHDTVFTDLTGISLGATPWIDLSALTAGDRGNLPFSFNRVTFSQDPQVSPARVNIKSGPGTPLLRCLGNVTAHGNRWGNGFEQDGTNVIVWNTGQISRTTPTGTFDTLEDALKDVATTASSIFTVTLGGNGFIDDFVDFNTLPGNVANSAGPVVKNACLAPMTGKAVYDSDGDTTRRGKIVNCIIARGTAEETTAENCTFFDPGAALITLNNMAGTNLLIENGYAGTGNAVFTTSLATATAAFFISATGFDFHLLSPGGDAAIDTGTALSTTTDIDGETRPVFGKTANAFDIGADEYVIPAVTTTGHKTLDTTPLITASGTNGRTIAFFRNGIYIGSAVVSGGVASISDPTAQADGNYTYTAAYDLGGGVYGPIAPSSALITIDTTAPGAPSNIRVTPYNGCVDIEWDASPSADVIGYRVQRKTGAGGTWATLNTGGVVTGTKYRDSGVTNGTTYFYRVSAIDNALPQ